MITPGVTRARSLRRLIGWAAAGLLGSIIVTYATIALGLAWSARELRSEIGGNGVASLVRESRSPHALTLLDDGLASLYARVALIRSARERIDLEFFIYDLDFSARWITAELIERARAGVRIRLLVDFAGPVFELRPEYAEFLRRNGIEVRYYNAGPLYRFVSMHHRNHRKLLVVDDDSAIVGGRNIADDYFGLSPRYNFVDSDALVRGEIVGGMRESFDLYWQSRYASAPEARAPRDFLAGWPDDAPRRDALLRAGTVRLASQASGVCRDAAFVTDFPGVAETDRRVYPAIAAALSGAGSEIVGESPYFVLTREGARLISATTARGVRMQVLTNSLPATDAYYTVAALWQRLPLAAEGGLTLLAYPGTPAPDAEAAGLVATRRGTHAKRAVIDGRHYLIGTYNVDPRSANLNSEMVFICRDAPDIAAAARSSILARMEGAPRVAGAGQVDHAALVTGADPWEIARMLAIVPLANLFGFLL
ncbi:MAG: phosphatidylserine/phosphatidylglycerophosphate/cardiolipin synthase family protein [Betaproteobacteria bacterium]|nr:phosphatidylserine/phosphatidylglycerophosphate/cardiolipin synthase family protein [Betaproteobacteria bacterium]